MDVLCRICLVKIENDCGIDVFSESDAFENVSICDMIRSIASPVEIQENDEFTKTICQNCLDRLNNCYQFALLILQSDSTLRHGQLDEEGEQDSKQEDLSLIPKVELRESQNAVDIQNLNTGLVYATTGMPAGLLVFTNEMPRKPQPKVINGNRLKRILGMANKGRNKCIIKGCDANDGKEAAVSFHELPSQKDQRLAWQEILKDKIDHDKLYDRSTLCNKHFGPDCFVETVGNKRRRLAKDAIPTIFKSVTGESPLASKTNDKEQYNVIPTPCRNSAESHQFINKGVQCDVIRTQETTLNVQEQKICALKYDLRLLKTHLRRLRVKHNGTEQKLQNLKSQQQLKEVTKVQTIIEDGKKSEATAVFLLDQLNNYKSKKTKWSEITMRQCLVWRESFPKCYEFARSNGILKLPSRTTLQALPAITEIRQEQTKDLPQASSGNSAVESATKEEAF